MKFKNSTTQPAGSMFIINEKINPGTVVVSTVPTPSPSVDYTYASVINGTTLTSAVAHLVPRTALTAAMAPAPGTAAASLTPQRLHRVVREALAWWRAQGVNVGHVAPTQVRIADLPGLQLGQTDGKTIFIDVNGAGYGWSLDAAPGPRHRGAAGRMDLLSVVTHELGHRLGFDHQDGGIMAPTLAAGARPTTLTAPGPNRPVFAFGRTRRFATPSRPAAHTLASHRAAKVVGHAPGGEATLNALAAELIFAGARHLRPHRSR